MLRATPLLSLLLLTALIISACQPITATPAATSVETPGRILFLGDYLTSVNLGIGEHTASLAASAIPPLSVEVAQFTLDEYGRLEYLWNETNVQEQIRKGNWDVVVLEENLARMTDPEVFKQYVRYFEQEIESAGAKTVLYMPWEYDLKLKQRTIDEIADAYGDIGAELDIEVAPVGIAWQRAHQERPQPSLYAFDRSMPSIHGTYLTACVLYATIFDKDPSGLSYRPSGLFPDAAPIVKDVIRHWPQISDDEAAFLQRIAWETVQDYQAQK
jgi:hypothetical protein